MKTKKLKRLSIESKLPIKLAKKFGREIINFKIETGIHVLL